MYFFKICCIKLFKKSHLYFRNSFLLTLSSFWTQIGVGDKQEWRWQMGANKTNNSRPRGGRGAWSELSERGRLVAILTPAKKTEIHIPPLKWTLRNTSAQKVSRPPTREARNLVGIALPRCFRSGRGFFRPPLPLQFQGAFRYPFRAQRHAPVYRTAYIEVSPGPPTKNNYRVTT